MVSLIGKLTCRIASLCYGLVWINIERVSTGEGDYSRFLGPDWRPTWEGAGTIVSNHCSFLDIGSLEYAFFTSFVSKKEVKNWPLIGKCAVCYDCIFVERGSTKESKQAVLKQIQDRQADNERTGRKPILIFPEGATTNNEQVIQFKQGPFSALLSVTPVALKYWSLNGISPQNDTLGIWHFYF